MTEPVAERPVQVRAIVQGVHLVDPDTASDLPHASIASSSVTGSPFASGTMMSEPSAM